MNKEIIHTANGERAHIFSYNSQGRLAAIGPQSGFGFHESIDYSYSGNITTIGMALAQQGPDTLEGVIYNYRTNYTYDDLGQLTGAVHNDNALTDLTMTYDPNGNILTQNNQTYNYISGTNKVKNTDGQGNDYTYNANGNITRANPKNIQQIRYDAFTQMTRRILTSRNITFQYDGSNRRVFRNHRVRVYPPGGEDDATDNPVMKQKYQKGPSEEAVIKDQYSGFSPAQVESKMMGAITWIYNNKLYLHGENEYPLVEYITSTNESETKQVYIYGATGLIATHRDSTTYTIIKDHLGSTRLVLDEDWAVVSWYDYAPFGKISRGGTGTKLNYRYTGQERDGATGLMNYRARMYDPDLGRFYAVDPAGQFASPYLYAANNPLSFTDPDGEWVWTALYYAYKAYRVYSTVNMAYQMVNAYQQGGVGAMVQTGMAMGFSHAIGSAVGPNVNFGTKIGETIASGALSSAISGGAVSSMFGGSFGEGALRGGISGGLSAGIGWFGTHASLNMQATAQGLTNDPVEYSTKSAENFRDNNKELLEMWHKGGKPRTLAAKDVKDVTVKDGWLETGSGKSYAFTEIKWLNFFAIRNPEKDVGWRSKVILAPRAFRSARQLYLTLGHEYIHAIDFYTGKFYRHAIKNEGLSNYKIGSPTWNYMESNAQLWENSVLTKYNW